MGLGPETVVGSEKEEEVECERQEMFQGNKGGVCVESLGRRKDTEVMGTTSGLVVVESDLGRCWWRD